MIRRRLCSNCRRRRTANFLRLGLGNVLGNWRRRSCFEALVVLERHLEEWRFELGALRVNDLVVANLKLRELLDHLRERQGHFTQICRGNFTGKEFRCLVVNGAKKDGWPSTPHSSFDFGGFQNNAPFRIDRHVEKLAWNTGDQVTHRKGNCALSLFSNGGFRPDRNGTASA